MTDAEAMALIRQYRLRVRFSHHKQQWVATAVTEPTKTKPAREINMAADDPAEAVRLVVEKAAGGAIDV